MHRHWIWPRIWNIWASRIFSFATLRCLFKYHRTKSIIQHWYIYNRYVSHCFRFDWSDSGKCRPNIHFSNASMRKAMNHKLSWFFFLIFQGRMLFITLAFVIRIIEALGNAAFLTASFAIIAKEFPDKVSVTFASLETFFGLGLIGTTNVLFFHLLIQ